MVASLPANEEERLAALRELAILDTPFEEAFDRVTRMAAKLFRVPISLVTLVDEKRQWFKSCFNYPARESGRELSFCAHAILQDDVLVVPDARLDPRFADNPVVEGENGVRFYAGAPLKSPGGLNVGTLCIVDTVPRAFPPHEVALLADLAAVASDELSLRNSFAVRQHLADRLEVALAKLKAAESMRESLTQMLVHDLRNPLTGLISCFEVLRERAAGKFDETELELVGYVEQSAEGLNSMITSLLDVHRLEAGEMPLQIQDCDLREVVRKATKAARELRDGSFSVDVPPAPAIVPADESVIERVIANLVSNALKFTRVDDRIRVIVETKPAHVQVSVSDEGPGIPQALHPVVFEKFGQVAGRKHVNSSGLGLTFCKLAVEAHGGTIGLTSEVGQGSTFSFQLPCAKVA